MISLSGTDVYAYLAEQRQQLAALSSWRARDHAASGFNRAAIAYQLDAADHAARARALRDLATLIPEQVAA